MYIPGAQCFFDVAEVVQMQFQRERSKYIQVYEALLEQIKNEDTQEEKYLPSERLLGERFGVDRLTVRKALNLLLQDGLILKRPGKGTVVLPRIQAEASADNSHTVAFILPRGRLSVDRITEPFHSNLFYSIGREIRSRGYNLLYSTIDKSGEFPAQLMKSGVAGFIFVSQTPEKALNQAEATNKPLVLVNRLHDRFPMVLEDRINTAKIALDYLYSLGHRRIFFINGMDGYYTTDTCRDSYMDFVHLHSDVESRSFHSSWNFENGMEAMGKILENRELPTAVCACNASVALGAMEAAKQRGLQVPGDISFIGFDETEQCTQFSPSLTSVGVDIPLLARVAVDTLFSSLEHGSPGAIRTVVPVKIFMRNSTAPATLSSKLPER